MKKAIYNGMRVDAISVRDESWRDIDFSKYTAIFHVAAVVHQKEKKNTLEIYRKVNRDLPFEIAKKAKAEGVSQFVFMSSIAIFGKTGAIGKAEVIDGETSINPNTLYGKTKAEAEAKIQSLSGNGFNITILRPPMVYGKNAPGNYGKLSKFALKLPVLPNIKNQRSMIFIENLSEFVYQIIDQKIDGIYCPQNLELVDTNQMIRIIREVHGKKTIILPFGLFAVKVVSIFTGKIDKIYGGLIIKNQASSIKYNLNETLQTSIIKSEF